MGTYRVRASDGLLYTLEGPPGMTPAQLEDAINSYNTGGAQPPAPAPAQAQPPAAPEQQTGSSKLKEFTEEVMRNAPGLSRYAPPRSSGGVEAFGRAAEKSVLPTAVGAGAAGLTSKAVGSTAARFIGKGLEVAPNPLIKAAGYGLEYGAPLVAGMGFGSGAHVLQEKALQANPEAAKALEVDEEKMQALQEQYPLASFAGSLAPGFALGTPPIKELRQLGAIGRARPDLAPYTSQMQSYIRKQAGVMGGVQSGINFGQQLWDADGDLSKVDIGQVGLAGAAGLLQSSPTRLGHAVFGTEPVDLRSKAKTEQTTRPQPEAPQPEAPPAGTPRLEGPGEEAGAPPPRRPTPTAPPETNPDADLMNILGMTPKTAPPPAISAENQPYFTTSSGSAYYLNDEGTGTIRQRSPSEAKDDVGLSHFDTQPASSRTVYLSQQGKEALAPWSSGDFDVRFNPQKKQAYLVYNNGPRQGQIATGTTVPYETEPKVGLYPTEHFDYEGYEPDFMHFGNVITQVNPQQPKPPEAVTPKPPEAPKTITALPNRNTLTPDASEDSILQFLAKHTKGLSKEEAIKQGIDPDVFRPYRDNPASVGLKSAFKKDGMSFDQAAQILSEQGYPVTDENGNYSPNVLLDHILDELRGNPKHSDSNTRWAQEQEFNYLTKQYPDAKIVKPKVAIKPKNTPAKVLPSIKPQLPGAPEPRQPTQAEIDEANQMEADGRGASVLPGASDFTPFVDYFPEVSKIAKSFRLRMNRLRKAFEKGTITAEQYAEAANRALEETKKPLSLEDRKRGMHAILETLNHAVQRGWISPETEELVNWFLRKNPAMVDDLALTLKNKLDGNEGTYNTAERLVTLLKGGEDDTTAVHEILHHLERLMPPVIQNAIRKDWLAQFLKAAKNAKGDDQNNFFDALYFAHFASDSSNSERIAAFDSAIGLIREGRVPYALYQYYSPSEYWAVNGARILEGKSQVPNTIVGRIKQWLKEFWEKIKSLIPGIKSDSRISKAINSIIKGNGEYKSGEMLQDRIPIDRFSNPRRLTPEPEKPEAVPGSTEARMQDAEAKIKERARSLTGELDKTPIKDRIKEVRENVDKYLDKLKEGYQNVFWPSEKIQRGIELRPGNHLIISGQDANNLYMKQATMDTRAAKIIDTEIDPLINKLHSAMLDYATSKNYPSELTVQTIGDYLKARHADERRSVFFARYRPLKGEVVPGAAGSETGMAPYKIRQKLLAKVAEILADNKTPYEAKRLALEKISDQLYRVVSDNRNADPFGISPQRKARGYYGEKDQPLAMPTNWSAELYAPAYGTTPAEMASIRMLMQRDLADPVIGPKLQKILDLHDKELLPLHRKLNKQSGSWAENTDLIVDGLYGFENYAALKGKASESDLVDLEGTRNLGDVAGLTYGMEGGRHTIENPLLQLISDTYRAARKASREGITLRVKNLIDQGYLAGEHVADIPASEQFLNNDILDKYPQAKNSKSIFHKLPNGDIQVYHVNNEGVLNGLRRPFDELSTYEKVIKYMTSAMAQQYTRFRLAFHPLNFVNDTLYNSTVLPSRYEGSIDKLDYLSEVFKNAVRGNGFKGLKYARYYRTDFNKLKEAARTDPYARDVLDWMNEGGPALYGQVLDIDTAYKKFSKLSSGPVSRTAYKSWEAVDAGLDYWAKSWDFLSRVTAYSMMKKVEYRRVYDREIAAGKSETEARVIAESEAREIAAYQAKQLGNFSLYGSKRYLPIRYMFFRPGATTVAKTLELLAPAWRSEESQLQNFLPEAAKLKPEEVSHAREKIRKAKNIALGMIRAFFGYGMAFYAMNYLLGMMLPGDEQGRNRVANDDKSQSVRGFRVPLPWDKKHFVNAPLSFGPLNIINMGYQTASFLNPADSNFMNVDGYTGNMLRIASNMFSPIQPSAINPTKYPVQFLSDTLLPSVAKPVGQLAMNMTPWGSKIYNDTPGRISDVYTGGQTVPQIYKDLSDAGYKAFETEIPPSMVRFASTNYLNGVADMASMGDEIIRGIMKAAGSPQGKTPDAKVFVGSIIGNRASTDTANYTAVSDKIAAIKRDIATAEATGDPQLIIRATKKHAMDQNAIAAFNANLGKMRGIQKRMKELRANQIMPLEAKSKLLDALQSQLELEKRLAVDSVKPFGVKP
ncbi:MAG: hypothetical protein EBY29_00680 [Planctomycetes bacterium]|nr:hypothetical protein [Planctomycetota bacterium]